MVQNLLLFSSLDFFSHIFGIVGRKSLLAKISIVRYGGLGKISYEGRMYEHNSGYEGLVN